MLDAVEGSLSSGRTVLVGWVIPFGLVALPGLALLTGAGETSTASMTVTAWQPAMLLGSGWPTLPAVLAMALLVLAGGLVSNLFRTPLYRVLTGNLLWPRRLADHRRMSHFVRRNRLRDRAAQQRGTARALLAERAQRYPGPSDQLAPTLLGNAVRRVETFGFDRYRLDARLLWQELRSVAPAAVLDAEARARRAMDFFVCLVWSLSLLALVSVVALGAALAGSAGSGSAGSGSAGSGPLGSEAAGSGSPAYGGIALALILAIAGAYGAYLGAVRATDRWDATVRGLVNRGRLPLASSLGLRVPGPLEQEREMWRRVNWLVRLDFDERIQPELDRYREPSTEPPSTQS